MVLGVSNPVSDGRSSCFADADKFYHFVVVVVFDRPLRLSVLNIASSRDGDVTENH